jgi:DNA-binding HxlR family transcriptional regulator
MATNILADRLRQLLAVGLIQRRGEGRGAEYALTAKGADLLPAMLELIAWSARHDRRTAAPRAFVTRIRNDRTRLLPELRSQLERQYG